MSTVEKYQAAYRKHQAAKAAANDMVQQVYNISNAIGGSLRSFMGWNFQLQIDNRREQFDPKAKVDVKKWPSADQLAAVLKAWNEADSDLRKAWDDLPPDARAGLESPPRQMQLEATRY